MTKARVQELPFRRPWGGARKGAGRKPKNGISAGVAHDTRVEFAKRFPLHVTLKLCEGLPTLRDKRVYRELLRAFAAGCGKTESRSRTRVRGFRLAHFVVMGNHLHLVCEADDRHALSRGMQGLSIRIAKTLNRLWNRTGPIFADRYHARVLRTPREVRNVLRYVLQNARKHSRILLDPMDPYSSGPWFDGWTRRIEVTFKPARPEDPVAPPSTWLLATGWRRHGALEPWPHHSP